MHTVIITVLISAFSLLECIDAHGFHHPTTVAEDPSFDNIVEQKYPTLDDLDPTFVATHRRKMAEDATFDRDGTVCKADCHFQDKKWYSCDDLVFRFARKFECSYLETSVCRGADKCKGCICSCEKTCVRGAVKKTCDEWLEADEKLTCDILRTQNKCSCRGCKCMRCTQKCSMRDKSIKGSHDCSEWYKVDPAYTDAYLKKHAVVSGTDKACECAGCSGDRAMSFCRADKRDAKSRYLDIETAKAHGKTARMRVTINDDMVDPEKCKKNAFCRKHTCLEEKDIGTKELNECEFERGRKDGKNCKVLCEKDDILTKEKSMMVRNRFAWLKTYMANLLSLKPMQDAVQLNKDKVHFIEGLTDPYKKYENTDLVVVVTMRPSAKKGVAGHALALQRDGERRVTVGLFNWAPRGVNEELYKVEKIEDELSNTEKAELLYAKAADYRLMVHEVLHLTGAIKYSPHNFINKAGKVPCSHQIYVDEVEEWSGHLVRKLRTPKLLALARKQYGCSSLTGVPIEDHHIGYGAHWEARVFGPEVMAYGDNSGESYLSDLTLAYLEDTGYFVTNYTHAGRLTPHTAYKYNLATVPNILTKDPNELREIIGAVNTSAKSNGYTRWGRHAGCAFVTGAPKNWPPEYRCADEQATGCTPDHKMSGRCTLETWGATAMTSSILRCEPAKNEAWGNDKTSSAKWKCINGLSSGGIPGEYRHIDPTSTLAGYNDAMDFVPHIAGLWNCQDQRQKRVSPLELSSEAGSSQNVSKGWGDLFGTLASDASSIGGQTFCENCRCFKSSLVPIATNLQKFSPTFPTYGLCYISNCVSKDYLQVGIKGVRGVYWYGCKPEGGKMYFASFSGALHCPVAKEFCAIEAHSDTIYRETDPFLEGIAYAIVAGVLLIAAIVLCALWKKIDHKVHFCCGIDQDSADWEKIMEKRHGKHSASAYCLTVICAIWCIAGAALLIFGGYSFVLPFMEGAKPLWDTQARQAPLMMMVGIFTIAVSVAGIEGAWKNHPTITLITYFYVCASCLAFGVVIPILPYILSEPLELILASQWIRYKNNFPDSWQHMNSTAAMTRLVTVELPAYITYFAIGVSVLIASLIIGIVCSILQLTIHVLVRNFEVVMNMVFFFIGVFLVYFATMQFQILNVYIYVFAIVPACFLFLAGFIGVGAACQKHETCFKIWAVVASVSLVATLVCASFLVWVSMNPPVEAAAAKAPSTCLLSDLTSVICEKPKSMCCSCVLDAGVDIKVGGATTTTTTTTTLASTTTLIKSYTGCEKSCFDVDGYKCKDLGPATDVESTAAPVSKRKRSGLMQIGPYIRALPEKEISKLTLKMSESLDIADFSIEQLIAWSTAYIRLYAIALYICCAILFALFATNRLIIHWNHQNDFPHGDTPAYLMFALATKKQRMKKKLKMLIKGFTFSKWKSPQRHSSLLKSISMSIQSSRSVLSPQKGVAPITNIDQHYPEIVMLEVRRASAHAKLNAKITAANGENGSTYLIVGDLWDGPLSQAGLMMNDVILTVDNFNITTMPQLSEAITNKTNMEFVVKRMALSQGEKGRRGNKTHTCTIEISSELGLGLNLKSIRSGGTTYLYVQELMEYPDFAPGPGLVAGVRQYDLILKINDMKIHNIFDAKRAIEGQKIAKCEVRRMIRQFSAGHPSHPDQHHEATDVSLVLTRSPGESLGLSMSEAYGADSVDPFLVVMNVRDGGAGARAGFKARDMIWTVQGQDVFHLDDLKKVINGLNKFEVVVRRE